MKKLYKVFLTLILLLLLDSSFGQIGIGTTNPKAKLDVKGDIGIEPLPFVNKEADGITSIVLIDLNDLGAGGSTLHNTFG